VPQVFCQPVLGNKGRLFYFSTRFGSERRWVDGHWQTDPFRPSMAMATGNLPESFPSPKRRNEVIHMKKILSVVTALSLSLALLAGCGGSSSSSAPASSAEETSSAGGKFKVGIIQMMEHPSLDEIRTAFLDEMAALGYGEDQVEFLY